MYDIVRSCKMWATTALVSIKFSVYGICKIEFGIRTCDLIYKILFRRNF